MQNHPTGKSAMQPMEHRAKGSLPNLALKMPVKAGYQGGGKHL
jgi:hypothetical protein